MYLEVKRPVSLSFRRRLERTRVSYALTAVAAMTRRAREEKDFMSFSGEWVEGLGGQIRKGRVGWDTRREGAFADRSFSLPSSSLLVVLSLSRFRPRGEDRPSRLCRRRCPSINSGKPGGVLRQGLSDKGRLTADRLRSGRALAAALQNSVHGHAWAQQRSVVSVKRSVLGSVPNQTRQSHRTTVSFIILRSALSPKAFNFLGRAGRTGHSTRWVRVAGGQDVAKRR